ncbi:TIGR03767 family metallophosphoesterase [Streptomyces sp. NPDC018031]|uniref:TIGR03767 family metallophosphoesterase n=1 Tax=Streptomyces sp. NPDC018031 TaxID=3365033 RepID=UPI0037998515
MSRIRSAAAAIDRRTLLVAAGAAGAATGLGMALGPSHGSATASPAAGPDRAARAGDAGARPAGPFTAGTTLQGVAAPRGGRGHLPGAGYRRLGAGPGWQRVVRTDLARAHGGRDRRRTALASFVHLTDLHLTDVQHPVRYEFLRSGERNAWRPHEALTAAGAVSLVERINRLPGSPVTGAPLGFAMTTGDNTDNNSRIELDWYLTAMSGGRITPDSGDPGHYEGVQNSGIRHFWHPESALRDIDKRDGFPRIDGFLRAALRTLDSPGLRLPWYSTVGNHDGLSGGVYAFDRGYLTELATGDRKLEIIPAAEAERLYREERKGADPRGARMKELWRAHARDMRTVTADERRAPFTLREYLAAHLDPRHTGAGPAGHGYTRDNLDQGTLYYAFRISDDTVGISLDSTDPGGHYTGSVGTRQLRWLERTLKAHRDDHVLVFSHHYSRSMKNLHRDPARPDEARHTGAELVDLFQRHPQVLAWINGHSHRNEITPRGTFWEITTASHIDFPQLARIVEVTDNHDGTLSLFTTLVESAAPYRTDFADLSGTGLAALYRELSFNAPGARGTLAGEAADRNTELLLRKR